MTSKTQRLRAIGLAALMVLSVVAMSAPAAAAPQAALSAPDDAGEVAQGQTFEVTYTITNDGDEDAGSAGLELNTPDGVTAVSASGDGTAALNQNAVFYINGIAQGSSVTTTVTYEVASDASTGDAQLGATATVGDSTSTVDTTVTVTSDDGTTTPTPTPETGLPGDETLQSGTLFYQGQELGFTGQADTLYEVREVTGSGSDIGLGSTIVQERTNESGVGTIDTTDLDRDDFVLVRSGSRNTPRAVNADGEVQDGSSAPISDAAFEITLQNLDVEFDEDTVDDDESVDLDISSSARASAFNVTVDADGVSESELEDIFATRDPFVNEDDDVEFATNGDDTLSANFTDIDAGDYEFNFSVTDTTAEASDSISVDKADDAELGLNESSYTVESGDTVNVTLTFTETDTGFIQIGSEDDGYNTTVEVIDDDEDGMANVTVNTFNTAGSSTGGVTSADDGDTIVNAEDVNESVNGALDTGNYDIQVSRNLDDINAETPDALGTLAVTDRATTAAQPWVTFRDAADDLESGDDVISAIEAGDVTQRRDVAERDLAVIQVQASGIFGYLDNQDSYSAAFGPVDEDTTTPLSLQVEQTNPGQNRDAKTIPVSELQFIEDDERNMLFIVVPTTADAQRDGETVDIEDGDQFNATFEVNAVEEDDNVQTLNTGNSDERVSANFRVTEREAPLNTNADDLVEASATEDAELTGTTTIAPGSEITVRVRSESGSEDPFVFDQTVNVSSDGTYNATFDFSDRAVGTNFTATVSAQPGLDGDTEFDGVVVEQQDTPTATPTPTDTPTATPTATPTPTDTPTATPTPDTETTTTTTPGFGAVVAVLALLGAALLALRRD